LAPWTLVEANDKRFARIKVLVTICDRLRAGIDRATAAGAKPLRLDKLEKTG
ncbi:MAG: hypothetical protein ACM3Q0_05160, partial [Bacteroidota bacterium]